MGNQAEQDYLRHFSLEAEQAVVGGILFRPTCWDELQGEIRAEDFADARHRAIFKACEALVEETGQVEEIDEVNLPEKLRQMGLLEQAGGFAYLGDLIQNTPSAANVTSWAKHVSEHATLRSLERMTQQVTRSLDEKAARKAGGVSELLDEIQQGLDRISERGRNQQQSIFTLRESLQKTVENIDAAFKHKGDITGVPTGFADLDRMTSGLHGGDLVFVAGRPSQGKTTFSMNIAENVAMKGLPVGVFSLEMPHDQLSQRMVSSISGVGLQKMRTGRIDDSEWPLLIEGMSKLGHLPLRIADTPGISVGELGAMARRMDREFRQEVGKGLGLIVIDYLQLLRMSSRPGQNRAEVVGEQSGALKALARQLDIPIIVLSQLNRSLEQRPNKRPIMSDLRESGSLEQDADLILFTYRDEVYHPDTPDKGIAEIIVGKQRNGPIGDVRLLFEGDCVRFRNLAGEGYESAGIPN